MYGSKPEFIAPYYRGNIGSLGITEESKPSFDIFEPIPNSQIQHKYTYEYVYHPSDPFQ